MTKVSRRERARQSSQGGAGKPRKRVNPVQSRPGVPSERVSSYAEVSSAPVSSTGATRQDLPQYPHMFDEVKRIGMIAGTILVVLVILSVVI